MNPSFWILTLAATAIGARGCELCAVYRAAESRNASGRGFVLSLSEQFVPFHTQQLNGRGVTSAQPDRLDILTTHVVPGYDFSDRFGLSLSVPVTHVEFSRTDIRYSLSDPPAITSETGSRTSVGDVSLIARLKVWQKRWAEGSVTVNVLGGIKFPTGDADAISEEMAQAAIYKSFLPPGTPHDPLGHSFAGVHQHSLATGSGSYDGIFGLTAATSWNRWFLNGQFQYLLRTRGEAGFKFGDQCMVSGGPGFQVVSSRNHTVGLQAFAAYDTMARDKLSGIASDRTGSSAWYLGPLVTYAWNGRLSANAGIDIPLSISNNGFQNVPDYRLHGGLSWRF